MNHLPKIIRASKGPSFLPCGLLCATALFAIGCTPSDKNAFPSSEGWVSLFNSQDLTGWETKLDGAENIWSVKDGVIDCEPNLNLKGDKNLWSTRSLEDFTLHAEWRIKRTEGTYLTPTVLPDGSYLLDSNGDKVITPMPGADSGIYLRGSSKAQLNIWTWPIGSGEVYGYRNNQKDPVIRAGVTPKLRADNPIGEWNTFHVTLKGDRLTVDLNGKRVLDNAQLPGIPEAGPIALQHHGGYDSEKQEWNGASSLVQFRNIYVKELQTKHTMSEEKTVLAVFAHPDDIEFCAAGTLLLLKERGWDPHYLNLSSGDLGSSEYSRDKTRSVRRKEGEAAAEILGAQFHESLCDDMQIFYTIKIIRRLNAVIREVQPDIILTHSPSDYMSDHENTSRLAVSAAFARGMPNFESDPPVNANGKDVSLYHAMPHGLRDPLRQRIRAELYADTSSVHSIKRQALAAHVSQKAWLDETQGMDSYLVDMDRMSQEIGKLSEKFEYAEGWRRHLHLGFSTTDQDPLREALSDCSRVDEIYQQGLETPS